MLKFLFHLVSFIVYPFSFLFPRSKRKWAFGSFRGAFNDNAKYLFLYCSENVADAKCAWLSMNKHTVRLVREKGLVAYNILSPRGLLYALTSKYWFFNSYTSDILFCASGGVVAVNLWHGLILKRIEFGIDSGPLADRFVKKTLKERFSHPECYRRPDYVLSSNPFQTEIFARDFRVDKSRCLEFGYPRNTLLLSSKEECIRFVERYEPIETADLVKRIKSFNRTYIYMPTWRDSQRSVFVQSMNLDALNTLLKSKNEFMILKPHVNVLVDGIEHYSNIMLVDSKVDVYAVLPFVDVLVTDYSSVLYDFVLMQGKGVILYLYDYNDYVDERNFESPFDSNVVGPRAMNFEELLEIIDKGDYWITEDERLTLKNKYWGESGPQASQKIASFFQSLSKNKQSC